MFGNLYERLNKVDWRPPDERMVELLHDTWADIKIDEVMKLASRMRPTERINRNDLQRIEVTPDDVRSAVFCNMCSWAGTKNQGLLNEWFDLSLDEQNALLIKAFPDGRVYGV